MLLASLKIWENHRKGKVKEHFVFWSKEISTPVTAFLCNPPCRKHVGRCIKLFKALGTSQLKVNHGQKKHCEKNDQAKEALQKARFIAMLPLFGGRGLTYQTGGTACISENIT